MGGLGLFGLPSYINPKTGDISSLIWVSVATLVAAVLGFVLTYFTYSDEEKVSKTTKNVKANIQNFEGTKPVLTPETIVAPVKGDRVKKGQLLLEFDINKIKEAGLDVTTPIIVTNTFDYEDVVYTDTNDINLEDEILYLV
ncbi:PTS glucose transporter subunit IIA [Lachnobacterium bovis]|uniref:PTS glucose transporter subunit IIA n=1 Tax=Lachnobacterium bovis TaxID=140626 RepID=UPI0003B3900C|nr:PTS glucose transporter subunit IIA [Lachnobacterium bovis]